MGIGLQIIVIVAALLLIVSSTRKNGIERGKWYYYVPGIFLNSILGVIGVFDFVHLLMAFVTRSNRMITMMFAVIYVLILLGCNIGIAVFFRRKKGFQVKLYTAWNLIAYFAVSVLFWVRISFI